MIDKLTTAVIVVIGVPAVLIGYIWATEQVLRVVPERIKPKVRPWLWLGPAFVLLAIFLVYPTIGTILRSVRNRADTEFVGLNNFAWFFGNDDAKSALLNNILWLVLLTALVVGLGLIIAVLVDRVRYETFAKSLIFMPLAISMVAAGVIWLFMFRYNPPGSEQSGTLNAAISLIGQGPIPWLQVQDFRVNTLMLIVVMTWMWTGFAMVIISASLKGINPELMEAARVDGATEWQVFFRIIFPLLAPTVAVVATTMIITALKAFDIVFTMTSGNLNTDVIANLMYKEMFRTSPIEYGRASAIAVVLLVAIVPVMIFNIGRFRAQEAVR
ncbi:MAG TPA: sugar ABC transporter permease [Candidatus Limnocylindria bacterium]|jgi:alpha-glucoside transport system permease protein|nr:sugar ABC transporter permease [Candidatus Limnocylindria bacterium]